jgi:hypothetical protein
MSPPYSRVAHMLLDQPSASLFRRDGPPIPPCYDDRVRPHRTSAYGGKIRVVGRCPARPRSRGRQARPLLLLTTLEHLPRTPATTVRDRLDQAAHLLATLPGHCGAHWPLTGTAPDGSRRAGSGPLRQDRRHLSHCQVRENWRGIQWSRDVLVPAWAPRRWAAPLWAFRTTGRRALTVVVPCTNTGTLCRKEVNDT